MAKLKSPQYIESSIKKSFFLNYNENINIYKKVKEQKGYINGIFFWGGGAKCIECYPTESQLNDFKIKPIYEFYLNEIIKLCNNSKISLVYEPIPFNESSRTLFNQKVIEKHLTFTNSLTENSLNQFSNHKFFLSDSLYEDGHHMNKHGAKNYTLYIKNKYKL